MAPDDRYVKHSTLFALLATAFGLLALSNFLTEARNLMQLILGIGSAVLTVYLLVLERYWRKIEKSGP